MSQEEAAWLKLFFHGKDVPIPLWAVILTAADGDPLRAQEIDAGLSREWWEYWMVYNRERGEALKEANKADGI